LIWSRLYNQHVNVFAAPRTIINGKDGCNTITAWGCKQIADSAYNFTCVTESITYVQESILLTYVAWRSSLNVYKSGLSIVIIYNTKASHFLVPIVVLSEFSLSEITS
jgi:hypothetical protein